MPVRLTEMESNTISLIIIIFIIKIVLGAHTQNIKNRNMGKRLIIKKIIKIKIYYNILLLAYSL